MGQSMWDKSPRTADILGSVRCLGEWSWALINMFQESCPGTDPDLGRRTQHVCDPRTSPITGIVSYLINRPG